jgi:hypothetical protein
MKLVETLLTNSTLKEAKLYAPARKASEDPTIGITIHNQSAFHVIKDCAKITQKYLPFIVLEHYTDVFDSLRGKVTVADAKELILAAQKDYSCKQLLVILMDKIHKKYPQLIEPQTKQAIQTTSDFSSADPYGDYGSVPDVSAATENALSEEEIIAKAFSANV